MHLAFCDFALAFVPDRNGLLCVFGLVFNFRLDSYFLAGLAHFLFFFFFRKNAPRKIYSVSFPDNNPGRLQLHALSQLF